MRADTEHHSHARLLAGPPPVPHTATSYLPSTPRQSLDSIRQPRAAYPTPAVFPPNPEKVAYSPAGAEATPSSSHRRRTSRSVNVHSDALTAPQPPHAHAHSSQLAVSAPAFSEHDEMSLDRSPSPQRSGGWASPGLNTTYEEGAGRSRAASPSKRYGELNGGQESVSWASAKANSARVNGVPSYKSQNQGFFGRHMRKMSQSLPYFAHGGREDRYAEKEKLGRGRLGTARWRDMRRRFALISRRRKYMALFVMFIFAMLIYFHEGKIHWLGHSGSF